MDTDNPGTPARPEGDGPHGQIERTLAVIELLTLNAPGLGLFEIADQLRIPRSATHRILTVLTARGYVRQDRQHGAYRLTAKVASLGFTFLARSGVTDLAQPILDRLARDSGELVRLAVVDEHSLTWVAKAQGSPHGLRYDPEMGRSPGSPARPMAWPGSCACRTRRPSRWSRRKVGALPADYGPAPPDASRVPRAAAGGAQARLQ